MNIFQKMITKIKPSKKVDITAQNIPERMPVTLTETPMKNYRDIVNRFFSGKKDTSELYKFLYTEHGDDLGRSTLLNILNKRRSFLCGEGIQIVCKSKKHREFFDKFLKAVALDGSLLFDMAEQIEVLGFISVSFNANKEITLNNKGTGEITVRLCKNRAVTDQRPVLLDIVQDAQSLELIFNELRVLNNRGTKITPVIGGLTSSHEVENVTDTLIKTGWVTGQPLITTASNVQFISPNTDAVRNLVEEITALSQNISAKTGIPPHWLGKVEEMSNRAVATEMYEVIEYTTAHARVLLKECIYKILIKAQEIYGITKIIDDFTVDIPLLSASKFKSEITAVISAYQTGLITIEEARGRISGLPATTPDELIEDKNMDDDMESQMNRIRDMISKDSKYNDDDEEENDEDSN